MSYLKIHYNTIRSSTLWLSVKMRYVDLHHLHTVQSTQHLSVRKTYVMIQLFHANVLLFSDNVQSWYVQLLHMYTQQKFTFLKGSKIQQLFTKVYLCYLWTNYLEIVR